MVVEEGGTPLVHSARQRACAGRGCADVEMRVVGRRDDEEVVKVGVSLPKYIF